MALNMLAPIFIGYRYIEWGVTLDGLNIVLVLAILLANSTSYRTVIDGVKIYIEDSFVMFWIPLRSERIVFKTIEHIKISKAIHRYNAKTRSRSRTLSFMEYAAHIVYDNNQQFELMSSVDFDKVEELVVRVSESLKIPIVRSTVPSQ